MWCCYTGERSFPSLPSGALADASPTVQVGADVHDLCVGDRIFGTSLSGGLAEEALVDPAQMFRVPDGVDSHVAAGFELNYGTVWHGMVDLGGLKEGETLVVLGASGGVGMAAIAIGKALGARVVACASSQAKLAACRAVGADELVDYSGGKGALKSGLQATLIDVQPFAPLHRALPRRIGRRSTGRTPLPSLS